MNKDYFIQLTANLYRLTLLFPQKEPLRYKMRELGDEVLASLLTFFTKEGPEKSKEIILGVEKDLEILDGFFEIAKAQNWVSPFNVFEVQREYNTIKEELSRLSAGFALKTPALQYIKLEEEETEKLKEKEKTVKEAKPSSKISERQQRILEILKEKGKAQVWELKKVFPEVSKRTLRRDFKELVKQGVIEKIGERNETFYVLKGRTEVGQR